MKKVIALVLSLALAISVSTAFAAETVSIIGTPNPHIEILEAVKDDMAALGYELELIVTADYTTENPATMDGSVMANFFQHIPYLEGYNKDFPEEEQLVPVVFTHFEPMAIYPGTKTSLDDIAEGDKILVPNDAVNENRALMLLEDAGLITLPEDTTLESLNTKETIAENPYNLTFKEVEAAQLPNVLQDVDYAVINSNYAISANLNPVKDSLAIEGSSSAYGNILAVKDGNQNTDKIKALVAALESKKVADFIKSEYDGAVVSVVENPGDGFDSSVDYAALAGTTVSVAASPTPHAEILAVAKDILAEKDITLKVIEYTDYVQPNNVVESGEVDANYFQHTPYLDDFNAENGTHIVSVGAIHVEPIGVYGGKQTSLDAIKK